MQFRTVSRHSGMWQSRMLIWREGTICMGRIAMLVLILQMRSLNGVYFYALMLVALLCLATVPYMQKKMEEQGRAE